MPRLGHPVFIVPGITKGSHTKGAASAEDVQHPVTYGGVLWPSLLSHTQEGS